MKYYFIHILNLELKDEYGRVIDHATGINVCNEQEFNLRKSCIEDYSKMTEFLPDKLFDTYLPYLDDVHFVYFNSNDILELISDKYCHEISESTYNELHAIYYSGNNNPSMLYYHFDDSPIEDPYRTIQKIQGMVYDSGIDDLLHSMQISKLWLEKERLELQNENEF